jgi:hypothetical protein
MKKSVFSLFGVGLALAFTACNNSSESTGATTDTSASNMSATTTNNSTNNYAARADTVNTNVSAGNYLNPRTGKAYSKLNVDQSTGALTDETGQPVRRYVDKRTWWVYDTNNWDTVGSAQLKNNKLYYRGDKGDWEEYDKRWSDDAGMSTGNTDSSSASGSGSNSANSKTNDNGTKVKVSDKGDKVKIKKTDKQ